MGLRRACLKNRLLPIECYVLVGDAAAFGRWANAHFDAQLDRTPTGQGLAFVEVPRVAKGQHFHCVIWMKRLRRGNCYDAGVLAHEALHVAWRLLDTLGCYDEETHCYLVQWLVEEATHRLAK